MKYEMIFGDEKLFDGAPDDAEYAGWFCQEIRWYMILNGKILFSDGGTWCTSDNPYLSADIAAMRRIIKEPKRWTLEDKKAGMLPEVGSLVEWNDCGVKLKVTIESAFFNKSCAFSFEGRGIGIAEIFDLSPIETPAEKAKREEDEFVESTCRQNEPHSTLYSDGVRAAYRKLKGGE